MEQYHNWSLPASSSDRSAHEPSSCSLASTATSHQQLSSPFLASRGQAPSTSPASRSSSRSNVLQVSTHGEAAPTPIATQSWTRSIAFPSSSSLAAWRNTARSATQADRAESSKTHTSSTSTRKQQNVDSFASPSTSRASLHHSTVKMDAGNKKVFKPDELRQALMPTWDWLYRHDPESLPFREPVDPRIAPNYYETIKEPMDLSVVRHRLDSGHYTDPWDYVRDVRLIFENAWLYNRKTTRYHKYATKLSEVFQREINPIMHMLGYCCGRKYHFRSQILNCLGKQLCTIPRSSKYFCFQNRYTFCQKCFTSIPGDTVVITEDLAQGFSAIKKSEFTEKRNDHVYEEPFVECTHCGRKLHQICVMHLDAIWPQGFICDNCLLKKGLKRKENKFTAKRLQATRLGNYVESRVNNYMKKEAGPGAVCIRVLSSSEKSVEVKPGMRKRFVECGKLPEKFPYHAKAIFAFVELDGVDVCFFGMHVQEYDSDCPFPNTRRVYIAYLDSVHFFRPKQLRTAVYHEILLGYLDYVKQLGYTTAHIWACPPCEGDDYIFRCHPDDQKIPKTRKLQEWYHQMLAKGFTERIISDYKDILKHAVDDHVSSAAEMQYFEGDFWPNVLEESIKELDREEEEEKKRKQDEEDIFAVFSFDEPSTSSEEIKKNTAQSKSKSKLRKNRKFGSCHNGRDLTSKLYGFMEKHKDVFFVIKLHSAQSAASLGPISDPDPPISCELMDGRDAFLTMARERHYEFSTLRHAKFSTMALLYELHDLSQDKFVYTCDICKNNIETRYHCSKCEDFDLCEQCYRREGHQHQMKKLGLGLDEGVSSAAQRVDNMEERGRLVKLWLQLVVHCSHCRDANCRQPSCQRIRRALLHLQGCQLRIAGRCDTCRRVLGLCSLHARQCKDWKCPVPACLSMRYRLQQRLRQERLQREQLDWKCPVPACLSLRYRLQQRLRQERLQQEQLVMRRVAATAGTAASALTPNATITMQEVVVRQQTPQARTLGAQPHVPQAGTTGVQPQVPQAGTTGVKPQVPQAGTTGLQPQVPQAGTTGVQLQVPQAGTTGVQLQVPQAGTTGVQLQVPQAGTTGVKPQVPQARTTGVQPQVPQGGTTGLQSQEQVSLQQALAIKSFARYSTGQQTSPTQRPLPQQPGALPQGSRSHVAYRVLAKLLSSQSKEEKQKILTYLHSNPALKKEILKLVAERSLQSTRHVQQSTKHPLPQVGSEHHAVSVKSEQSSQQMKKEHSLQQASSQRFMQLPASEHPVTWVASEHPDLQATSARPGASSVPAVEQMGNVPATTDLRQALLQFVTLLKPPMTADSLFQLAALLRRNPHMSADFFRDWQALRCERLRQGDVRIADVLQQLQWRRQQQAPQYGQHQRVLVEYQIHAGTGSSPHLMLPTRVVVVDPSSGTPQATPAVAGSNNY